MKELKSETAPRLEQDIDKWVRGLKEAGWKKHATASTVWVSPWGGWYRGPYKAWCVMKGIPCK